jgi:DNA-binding GntR family transcriptional regulator
LKAYRTKKEMIYQILKEEILNGEYEANQKLVISHLALRFESSEIPVREAISQLESDNLIVFKPHIGAVVRALSTKDIQEIFELRVELEGLATRLAVEGLTDEDFKELRKNIDDSIYAFENKEYKQYELLNIDFHNKIYSACDNKLLIKTIRDLWSNTKRYPSIFVKNDSYIINSIDEHEEIYAALVQQESMLAESYMIKHKTRAGREILRLTQRDYYDKLNQLIPNKER